MLLLKRFGRRASSFVLALCVVALLSGCVTLHHITEQSVARSNVQLSSLETSNAVPRGSVLLSGTAVRYNKTVRPIATHDSSTTVSSAFLFITDSTFTDNASLMYQPSMALSASMAYSLSNHLLFGATYAMSSGAIPDAPHSVRKYLADGTQEFSLYFRFNTYTKPWSFSWRLEPLFGNVTGVNFFQADSFIDTSAIDYGFRSLTNTMAVRYQINKGIGLFGGFNFVSRPYAISGRTLLTDIFITPYAGLDLRFLREFTVSLGVASPSAPVALENYSFPLLFGAKFEWQWFFRRNQEAAQ